MSTAALSLISHPLCPYVQRVAIVLLEKDTPFDRIDVDFSAKPAWFLEISPTGKVPLLKIHGDHGAHQVLFESMAICEYLEETQAGAPLHPQDPVERAEHRAWIEFGSATLTEAWGYLNAKGSAAADAKATAFRDKLVRLEAALFTGPYFGGTRFSMVDAVFAPIFRYFQGLPPQRSAALFDGLPKIGAWRQSLALRPSVIAAAPPDYAALFQAHLRRSGSWLACQ
ncbi:glutathione S-transferase family protein [Acidovorax sp. SUPP950]|uniref:glutathione S-transferase family protein n=1 Tax=unclassified Acidovorax TaxID=2684926 RepID=UPI0023C8DE21|nr:MULTISPECIES: glutathione S-transferase family protein [Comamonadaceae]WOI43934.1 glutathione S-transferase family protein [Paracidovorax avenae]GKS75529.1 glutathione S-transferase family protein [Acidovorax sp. SUPP950]